MSENKLQNYSNHIRYDPPFHFFIMPVFVLSVVISVVQLIRHPEFRSAWEVLFCIAALMMVFRARIYAVKVQDRLICLEERLRLSTVLPEAMQCRLKELSVKQLVALRFASDAELPFLVEDTLTQRLSSAQIKQAIKNWRADNFRV